MRIAKPDTWNCDFCGSTVDCVTIPGGWGIVTTWIPVHAGGSSLNPPVVFDDRKQERHVCKVCLGRLKSEL